MKSILFQLYCRKHCVIIFILSSTCVRMWIEHAMTQLKFPKNAKKCLFWKLMTKEN